MFKQGEIVIANFPFTSLKSTKRRPCLILSSGDSPDDYIVAFITSVNIPSHYRFSIKISTLENGFLKTGLKVESFIRIDKIATLHSSLISGSIWKISSSVQKEVFEKLKQLFNI